MKIDLKQMLKGFEVNPIHGYEGRPMKGILLACLLFVGFALRAAGDVYSSQTFTDGFQAGGAIPTAA